MDLAEPSREAEEAAAESLSRLGAKVRRRKSGRVGAVDLRPCAEALDAESLRWLAALTDLGKLEAAGAPFDDARLPVLDNLSRLTHLDLQQTRVTDAGLAQLSRLKQLQMLLLTGTQVTREGLKPLRQALLNTRIIHLG
jgi:hypothetical protein